MDENYVGHAKPQKRYGVIVLFAVILSVVIGSIYLIFSGKKQIISPVPAQPAFEVIFYTPTPGPVTPTSTPSATPKPKKVQPTATPVKTSPTPSVKVTGAVTPSPTVKPTATLTPKP